MNARRLGCRLAAAVCAVLLLGGCGAPGERPVAGDATVRVTAPAPSPSAAPEIAVPTRVPIPSPAPTSPPARTFPMTVRDLFGAEPPEGFAFPLHLNANESGFLYATADGRVLRAGWNGSAYSPSPVAESLDLNTGAPVYVDEGRGWLFAGGSKKQPGGRVDPAIVMVNLATSERCDVADLARWSGDGALLSCDYQYCDGYVLSRLQEYRDGQYAPLNRWAVVDIARKVCSVLDMDAVAAKLPGVPAGTSPRLAGLGRNTLLAVFSSGGEAVPTVGSAGQVCAVYELAMDGSLIRQISAVKAAAPEGPAALADGTSFCASPDGAMLLYSRAGAPGVWLYDIARHEERVLFAGATRLAFSQWQPDGTALCGVQLGQNSDITILQAVMNQPSPSPDTSPLP